MVASAACTFGPQPEAAFVEAALFLGPFTPLLHGPEACQALSSANWALLQVEDEESRVHAAIGPAEWQCFR
jgi:hypothetical protein